MKVIGRVAFVVVLLVAADACAIVLVRDGKPVATIVRCPKATECSRRAAKALQAIVKEMSGAEVPIVEKIPAQSGGLVLVGKGAAQLAGSEVLAASNLDQVRYDGYGVTTLRDRTPPTVVIVSEKPRGTIYAVYDLLERFLGCGFFSDGDYIPKRQMVRLPDFNLASRPTFPLRPCYVDTRFYGPKRFCPALWNVADWKRFLDWMAKKKLNCLVIRLTPRAGTLGQAFEQAFPDEAKAYKTETLKPTGAPRAASITSRMGWGLHPSYTTKLWKEVLAYARNDLDIDVLYILAYGEHEEPLHLAHSGLKWLAPSETSAYGCGGLSRRLGDEPKAMELQRKLWQAIVKTYGPADHYLLLSKPEQASIPKWAREVPGLAIEALKAIDPEVRRKLDPQARGKLDAAALRKLDLEKSVLLPTHEQDLWGTKALEKIDYLRALPAGIGVFYLTESAPAVYPFYDGVIVRKVRRAAGSTFRKLLIDYENLTAEKELFAGRNYWYAFDWGDAASDLFENRFEVLYAYFLHHSHSPEPKATGFCSWARARGANPALEHFAAEFALRGLNVWRAEGASDNRYVRRYLARRYGRGVEFAMSEPFKRALRGAPRADPGVNYRAYAQWAFIDVSVEPSARDTVERMVKLKATAGQGPFFETDLADLGRSFLHEHLYLKYREVLELVTRCQKDVEAGNYTDAARTRRQGELATLSKEIVRTHETLTRLIATRKDMCLDEAIREACATPGANKNLAKAIREHQSGAFANALPLVDSIEYHVQLKRKQIRHFLDYAAKEVANPSSELVKLDEDLQNAATEEQRARLRRRFWLPFFLYGTREFIEGAKPEPYETKAEKAQPSEILQEFLKTLSASG